MVVLLSVVLRIVFIISKHTSTFRHSSTFYLKLKSRLSENVLPVNDIGVVSDTGRAIANHTLPSEEVAEDVPTDINMKENIHSNMESPMEMIACRGHEDESTESSSESEESYSFYHNTESTHKTCNLTAEQLRNWAIEFKVPHTYVNGLDNNC